MRARGRAPSETPYRATGTIQFLAPSFGVAAARGLVVEECVDTGVSGAQSSGPARNKLLEAARLRQIDLVLVLRLDRWGRSVADCVDTLRLLKSYGVAWLATSQGLSAEASSLMGRSMMLERGMIVQRVVAGVKKAQAAGKLAAPRVESRLADPGRQSAGNWECRSALSTTPCQKAPPKSAIVSV